MELRDSKRPFETDLQKISEKLQDWAARERTWREKDQLFTNLAEELGSFYDEGGDSSTNEENRWKDDDPLWRYGDALFTEENRLRGEEESLITEKKKLLQEVVRGSAEASNEKKQREYIIEGIIENTLLNTVKGNVAKIRDRSDEGHYTGKDGVNGIQDMSQTLNRYAYCLDNPHKYVNSGVKFPDLEELSRLLIKAIIGNRVNALATQRGWFSELFYAAGFVRDKDGIYHIRPDCLQQYGGYNDFYDMVFDLGTSMDKAKFLFTDDGRDYIFWAWKGDYLNLGAGAEMGIYKRLEINGVQTDHWLVDLSLAMPMTMTLRDHTGTILSYDPRTDPVNDKVATYDKVWWITGFNPFYQNVDANNLTAVFTIDFMEHKDLYEAFLRSEDYLKDIEKWSISLENKYLLTFAF